MSITTKPKSNRSAAIAARKALLDTQASGAGPLPTEFTNWLSGYLPATIPSPTWPDVRPFVLDVLQRSQLRSTINLKKRSNDLAQFGYWLHATGHPLDFTSMTRKMVDEYVRVGMPSTINKSRTDRRARLRTIATQVDPHHVPGVHGFISSSPVAPPYTDNEIQIIRRVIANQRTPLLVRQLHLCVGLGLGAGIGSGELKLLHPRHVLIQSEGIRVEVPGQSARTLWARSEMEDLIRTGMTGARSDLPLIGRVTTRHTVAAQIFSAATLLGDVPKLSQSRLRTTWIAWLITQPIPLAAIAHATGLKTTRTLFEILAHLPAQDLDTTILRGGTK